MAASSQQASIQTPRIKPEASPAESFLSTPGDFYPPLFAAATPTPDGADPMNIMTPESFIGEDGSDAVIPDTPAPEGEGETETDKKPAKKRKSWGQVLPEPKTNLPPRKRAKTDDEKEQRRVERVLRNRRAAQSSRERKRLEVEALEQRNAELEARLQDQVAHSLSLMAELAKLRTEAGVVSQSPPSLQAFQPSPMTLSAPLFPDVVGQAQLHSGLVDELMSLPEQDGTVDPASISPNLDPVADSEPQPTSTATADKVAEDVPSTSAVADSFDTTQHSAEVLFDLQCPSKEPTSSFQTSLTWMLACSVMISMASLHPLKLLRGTIQDNLALHPTQSILSSIIWLVTLPQTFRTGICSSSSATTSAAPSPRHTPSLSTTLRIKTLRRLLTCSPNLARPLGDATIELLRLKLSESREDRVEVLAEGSLGIKGVHSRGLLSWPKGASLPSREVLLTLLWALKVEERRIRKHERNNNKISSFNSWPGSSVSPDKTSTNKHENFVLSVNGETESDQALWGGMELEAN
ncbi:hypothetical protein F4808DRAFT_401376 [Astrocystis sublimbata]|nr:hypothetical protein F4808DRAFT_401376 [Astrocystis sublimbata]